MLFLRLFVTPNSSLSLTAAARVSAFCREMPQGFCNLEVVDVIANPEKAEADGVMATPTLIRVGPLPAIRLVGDLTHLPSLQRLIDSMGAPGRVM